MANQASYHVSPEQWEEGKKQLAAAGFPVTTDNGEVEEKGFKVRWTYTNSVLTLYLDKKPFYVPFSLIKSKVDEKLAEAGIHAV